jgi:hypothetical protein
LAVDRTYQEQHFGELIVIDALTKALVATAQIASLAVIAEALDEPTANFYQNDVMIFIKSS